METSDAAGAEYARIGSYRTYEEWKRNTVSFMCASCTGSYRTYEEWKR